MMCVLQILQATSCLPLCSLCSIDLTIGARRTQRKDKGHEGGHEGHG